MRTFSGQPANGNFWISRGLVSNVIAAGVIIGTLLVIFPPDIVILKRISSHSVQIMLLLLGFGLIFFILNMQRLLFICFGCCAAMCLYFKMSAGIGITQPVKSFEPTFTYYQINTSNLTGPEIDRTLQEITFSDADMIGFVEVTPDWEKRLDETLKLKFRHRTKLTRIDYLGTALYSKYPVVFADTLTFNHVPSLLLELRIDQTELLRVILSNTHPPLYRRSFEELRAQLDYLAAIVKQKRSPTIVSGNFNLNQFSTELQSFRSNGDLLDSRKGSEATINPPTDHIFYSPYLECLSFGNLYNRWEEKIGIRGEYQFKAYPQL